MSNGSSSNSPGPLPPPPPRCSVFLSCGAPSSLGGIPLHKAPGSLIDKARIGGGLHEGLPRTFLLLRRNAKLFYLPSESRDDGKTLPLN
jgi:hypothetical protein